MPVIGFLLFALFWVGHGYWLMVTLNMIYSRPFNRTFLKTVRKIYGCALVFGPIAMGFWLGFDILKIAETSSTQTWLYWPLAYMSVCVLLGGIWFPIVTFQRAIRSNPAVVVDERSKMFDVEAVLGHRPIGDGKHRNVAKWTWNGLFQVEFTTIKLKLPGAPTVWKGLTILHLSDLHLYGTPDLVHYQMLMRRCMEDGVPDLVVLSGDVIDDARYLEWIAPILSELKWNIAALAILGNHDWWQDYDGVRERLRGVGFQVVSNSSTVVDVRGEPLVAVGHEGPWFRPPPDVADLPQGFRLLLSHSPDNIGWARRHGFRLMLSGHNHGGQIRVPLIGSMFVPSLHSRRYDMGTFHEGETVLHVNRGIAGKEPIRFRCPPQVTRFVLE